MLTAKRFSPWGKDGSVRSQVKLQPEEWITQITLFSQADCLRDGLGQNFLSWDWSLKSQNLRE
jgi:hypothetical protein